MTERVTKVRLSAEVSAYTKGMMEAAQATRTVGTEAEKLQQKREAFESIGRGALVAGAAMTAASALTVKAAMDWESAWAGVTKTVDATPAQLAEIENGLRQLARELPASHQEIAAVAEAAGQLGVQSESIVEFTRTMIDLGATTNLTADEAATSIAQLMNIMQSAPDDVDNLGAALVALGNNGASTERDIIQMAQNIAGAGQIVGLTEAEVLGFANALASVGIEAEAGGSAISRVMTDIAMAVSAGGDDLEKFAEVAGMSASQFQKAFRDDSADAIATFIEGLARIDAQGGDVFATLSALGQTDIRVSRALLGMANSGDLLRNSLELGAEAWADNTALAEEAAKRYETTEAQLAIMNNSVRDAAISFGQVLLPVVSASAEALAEFANFMGDLPDPVQALITLFGSVAGVLALVGGAALVAVPKVVQFKIAMDTLGLSMRGLALAGGAITVGLTVLVSAIGAVVAAQAEANQRAKAYADTLEDGTNRVTEATREMVKEALVAKDSFLWLEQDSAADAAEKLGINLSLVTDAALGVPGAMDEVRAALKGAEDGTLATSNSIADLENFLNRETDALGRAADAATQKQEADRGSVESSGSAAEAYLSAADAAGDLSSQINELITKINEANGVGQDAVSANANYQAALAGITSEVQRQRDEFEQANGTLNGFTLSLDESTAAGSSNAAMLADVAGKAQTAAAKQYELDKSTMSATDATNKYAGTLAAQREAFINSATAAGFNGEEVRRLADRIFALPSEKEVQILAETAAAQGAVDRFIFNNSGRRINLIVDGVPGRQVAGSDVIARANGGIESYANGGFPTGIYKGGTPIHKFAEPETGWEAYVSGRPGQRNRNIGILMEAGRRLGMEFGGGSGPTTVSLAGASLTMYVDGVPMRAVIQEQIVAADARAEREIDRGWMGR